MKATDQILACLGEIRSLKTISFNNGPSGKEVTDQGIESIKNLQNLRSFTLHNCDQISDQGYQHLGNLQRLEHIYMQSRRSISTNTLQSLGNLRKLKKLYLYGSGLDVPNETVKAFLSSYPELDYSCVGLGNKNPRAIRELIQSG